MEQIWIIDFFSMKMDSTSDKRMEFDLSWVKNASRSENAKTDSKAQLLKFEFVRKWDDGCLINRPELG
jgi:hypothetical protein